MSEKYENLLELSVTNCNTIKFDFPLSDYVWCVKIKMLMLFVAKLGIFSLQQELSRSKYNPIPFKR